MDKRLQEQLEIVASNENTLQALKSVFFSSIEKEKPIINETDNDNLLGQKFRAYKEATNIIDKAFVEIESYKKINENKNDFHKER